MSPIVRVFVWCLVTLGTAGASSAAHASGPSYDEYVAAVLQLPRSDPDALLRGIDSWETTRLRGLAVRLRRDATPSVHAAAALHLFAARRDYAARRDRRAADHVEAGLICLGLERDDVGRSLGRARNVETGPVGRLGATVPPSLRGTMPELTRHWLHALAYWYQASLLPEAAASIYHALLSVDGSDVDALLGLGTVDELLAYPASLVAGSGADAVAATERAALAASAERRYRRALEIAPNLAEAHVRLGRLLIQRGHPEEAREHLDRGLELDDEHGRWLAHLLLGRAAEADDAMETAIGHYRAAAALEPHYQTAHLALSHVLFRSGDAQGAGETLIDIFGDPRNGSPDGWAEYQMGLARRLPMALEILRQELAR